MRSTSTTSQLVCYHCGEDCQTDKIVAGGNHFCCEGCKMVYQLLNQGGLCEYYALNQTPGINQRQVVRKDKFAFLADPAIQRQLISYSDEKQTHVSFYLPQVHCSSCLYLLENLHRLNPAVISTRVNFSRKEVDIVFDHHNISLQTVAELLTQTGYEPYISLNDLGHKPPRISRHMIYRLGVAGFCFGNIMLLSFPEYLGIEAADQALSGIFRVFNVILALPVFFYSAVPFYTSGWKGLQNKFLNIDAPIALAIIVTFARSMYEVISGTGAGYFDSMAGIVFFMLAGRVLQEKTYQQLSFERDFTSYFPVAVTVLKDEKEIPTLLPDIKAGDTLLIHSEELIPADGILTRGHAVIDYSFVTGESLPVNREMGEIVYAGGRQTGGNIEILVIKEVAQSYLTRLWSRDELKKRSREEKRSFVHLLSRYFTYIVFTIALTTALYWLVNDSSKVWSAVTAILIIACPCALLLSNTFTNGNILRILSRNMLYLRNAQAIEDIAGITDIVFDKTGTLTTTNQQEVSYDGYPFTRDQQLAVATLAAQSNHPLSKSLVHYFGKSNKAVTGFREVPGKGIEGHVEDMFIALGSWSFISGQRKKAEGSRVYVAIDDIIYGHFTIRNHYREAVPGLVRQLSGRYRLSVVSGDNESEKHALRQLLGQNAALHFNCGPEDKLQYIRSLQQQGKKVMMIGDGLNDAGALQQSDVGIAVAEDCNNFTPASDAIMEARQLPLLARFIRLCSANKKIVIASFVLSITYNIIGLFFAVQGVLSPLVAAILMPASSISILLVTFGSSNLAARWLKLK